MTSTTYLEGDTYPRKRSSRKSWGLTIINCKRTEKFWKEVDILLIYCEQLFIYLFNAHLSNTQIDAFSILRSSPHKLRCIEEKQISFIRVCDSIIPTGNLVSEYVVQDNDLAWYNPCGKQTILRPVKKENCSFSSLGVILHWHLFSTLYPTLLETKLASPQI